MNRQRILQIAGVAILSCGLASAQRTTTFEAPGAGTGAGQGTLAEGITPEGKTLGDYMDASGVAHGFIRSARGNFTARSH